MSNSILQKILPDEYLKAIGLVTVSWSVLEEGVDMLIWTLIEEIDNPLKCVAITSHLTFVNKYNLAMSLSDLYLDRTKCSENYEQARKILNEANELRVKRNIVCHTGWIYEDDMIYSVNFTARTKMKYNPVAHNLKSLGELTESIDCCGTAFFNLVSRIIKNHDHLQKSWLRKLFERDLPEDHDQGHIQQEPPDPPQSSEE